MLLRKRHGGSRKRPMGAVASTVGRNREFHEGCGIKGRWFYLTFSIQRMAFTLRISYRFDWLTWNYMAAVHKVANQGSQGVAFPIHRL